MEIEEEHQYHDRRVWKDEIGDYLTFSSVDQHSPFANRSLTETIDEIRLVIETIFNSRSIRFS